MNLSSYDRNFGQVVESAKQEFGYQNYLLVRECVLQMLAESSGEAALPSHYWEEELAGFDYLLDASPLIIRKLREHSYHITGLKSYEYRHHHAHKAEPYRQKLAALRAVDASDLFVAEAPLLGGFGHEIDGVLVNIDTLKFYESLIALDRAGALVPLKNAGTRPVVVEIGGGWGGFGYQFKRLLPNTTYVIVDLPQTMLFSGVYLKTLFPEAKCFVYGEGGHKVPPLPLEHYDFVFMPHFSIDDFKPERIDLGINMISFQEMTSEQVTGYARWFWENGCEFLYSHNRARSAHNNQLSDVAVLLTQGYQLKPFEVLSMPYTVLNVPSQIPWASDPKKMARQLLQRMLKPVKKAAGSHLDYRHLFGRRKSRFEGGNA
ncbi:MULTISPECIES: putative sugar O-methyltransferase [Methylomonas]|uniref:Sugar O-methyltransferase n=1 Tax=Methylomonas koyamae TaxID=702114 RepID=A0A177NBC0_9GAMM|nr:putative sugar O-methyltransferase [Methylomonas koyamae]OAI14914.1 hypothetical protein A1355_11600 [Methylomonas koyamae]